MTLGSAVEEAPRAGRSESVPMRLALVISTLAPGGAERVLATLANGWAAQGEHVTLLTLDVEANDFYALHPGVRRIGLGCIEVSRHPVHALRNNVRRIGVLRRALRAARPHVVVAFTDTVNVLTLLATRGLGVPVVVSERIDPERQPLGRAWTWLRRWLYPRAAALVVQTERVRRWGMRTLPAERVRVIPNPLALPAPEAVLGGPAGVPMPEGPSVAAMGRLVEQKGFDLLLHAFAECRREFPGWRLLILGDGPERERLRALARELGIADAVRLPGWVSEPHALLWRAELFVLSSRYEGFPNALVEAMAGGVAAVAADCPSGPREIVRDGIDGLLVPPGDVGALAHAMRRLMADPHERARFGRRAREVRERFALPAVLEQWNRLIRRVRGVMEEGVSVG